MDLRVIPAGFQVEGAGWLNWGQLSGWMPIRRDHTVYTHEYNLFTKDEIILHIRPIFLVTMLLIYITINMVQHHPFEWLIVFHCTAVLPLPNPLLRLLDVVLFLFFFLFVLVCIFTYLLDYFLRLFLIVELLHQSVSILLRLSVHIATYFPENMYQFIHLQQCNPQTGPQTAPLLTQLPGEQ